MLIVETANNSRIDGCHTTIAQLETQNEMVLKVPSGEWMRDYIV